MSATTSVQNGATENKGRGRGLLSQVRARFGKVKGTPRPHATDNQQTATGEPPRGRLMRLREVVLEFCVHPNTVRLATKVGKLRCYTLPSGHRRFSREDVLRWLGVDTQQQTSGNLLVGICRVSSRGQATANGNAEKSSLEHQQDRIREFCQQTYGRVPDEWNCRVASGLNFEAPEFLALIQNIVSGRYKGATLVASTPDRICRFGRTLVEWLCEQHGATVVYVLKNGEAEQSGNETLVEDVLSVLTHFTARASGQKAKTILKVNMDQESLRFAYEKYTEGFSYRWIAEQFAQQGKTDEKGRSYTRGVVRKCLNENWEALVALFGEREGATSFHQFVKAKIRRTKEEVNGRKVGILQKSVYDAYRKWCLENNQPQMCDRKVSEVIQGLGWKRVAGDGHEMVFRGVSLLK